MGAPRRNRKKVQRPADIWNTQRITDEHKLRDDFGLKNLNELWRATSEIRRVRRNVRAVLSGRIQESNGKELVSRLSRYGIVKEGANLDDLLEIKPEDMLERRLQTVVLRKGLAKTSKQARQLITHGFIAIDGRRAKSPGYLVSKRDEEKISYYKPIDIENTKANITPTETAATPLKEAEVSGKETE
jgi:small subunit ribosomal protein S4